ncbi:aminopeptidase N [Spongisporangium articulatum]|uniref:Aminopeptidase N n=1 Tax=Spongisporangium articulatum TaxID=3362603 RepID=A0ABW8AS59_9ACTN
MASLTRDEARARAELLTVDSYDLLIDLQDLREGSTLQVWSEITFVARRAGETFVDIVAEQVEATLDGQLLDTSGYDGARLPLTVTPGIHRLSVHSTTTRTSERAGIHRVVDPGDGEPYVWTSFEPDDARRVFACFDQPDLKSTFQLQVVAPAAWTVASNTPAEKVGDLPDDARVWAFGRTPKLSTYLVVVCAGPFHEVRRQVPGAPEGGTYDLGLLARKSLAGYLDEQADELFDLTAKGLAFFGERFGMPFPQSQYTQVFCPDFQGAMENWGCVTWMDSFVFRAAPTATERELRAIILLHEMAHMWFGDIVTMRWWDDLWLNESFADWAAVWATAETTEFTGAWASFLGNRKEAGYTADRSPATHPIRQDVPTVEAAKAAFDMVTYAKGASVLRQLTVYAGEDDFVAGLGTHFERHAFDNATLEDLLESVGSSSGRELGQWAKEWLLTAGTDTLTLQAEAEDGRYTAVRVLVEPPAQYPAQRPHRLGLGVYDVDGEPRRRELLDLEVSGPSTDVPQLVGAPVADLLLLNDGDRTFARVRPDDAWLAALLEFGARLPDPVSRALVRLTLWHLVDDGRLAAREVVRYVVGALAVETEASVREGLLRTGVAAVLDWSGPADAVAGGNELARACLDLAVRVAPTDPATRLSALQAALAVASDADLLAELDELVGDDVDLRWRWLTRRAATGNYDEQAVADLLARDPDPDASSRAVAVRAARPEVEAKEEVWQAVIVERSVPLQAYLAVGRAFWDPAHAAVLERFAARYLDVLARLGEGGMTAALATVRQLFPRHGVDADFPRRATELASADDVSPLVRNQVTEAASTLERMLRARGLV